MDIPTYLKKVAYIGPSTIPKDDGLIYYSIFDGSYITRVGLEPEVGFLADLEITEELSRGVGFSPKDNKWYGWSHRAMFGFTIGSVCEKGHCHCLPENKEEFLASVIEFWKDDYHSNTTAIHDRQEIMHSEPISPGEAEQKSVPSGKFQDGVTVSWLYNDSVPNKSLRGTISSLFTAYPEKWGNGEWVAKTMGDAKQMAIDFNEGVS